MQRRLILLIDWAKWSMHPWVSKNIVRIDLKLLETSTNLKVCCIDPKHPQNSDRLKIDLKGEEGGKTILLATEFPISSLLLWYSLFTSLDFNI